MKGEPLRSVQRANAPLSNPSGMVQEYMPVHVHEVDGPGWKVQREVSSGNMAVNGDLPPGLFRTHQQGEVETLNRIVRKQSMGKDREGISTWKKSSTPNVRCPPWGQGGHWGFRQGEDMHAERQTEIA